MINKGYFTLYAVINFYFFYGIAALMKCGVIIICIILIPIIPVLILFAIRFWNGEWWEVIEAPYPAPPGYKWVFINGRWVLRPIFNIAAKIINVFEVLIVFIKSKFK